MLGKLHRGGIRHKASQHHYGEPHLQHHNRQGKPLDQIPVSQQPEHERPAKRQEHQERQNRKTEGQFLQHGFVSFTRPSCITLFDSDSPVYQSRIKCKRINSPATMIAA